jgi:hypothetical protein
MIIEPIVLHSILVEGIIVTKHNLKIGAKVKRGPDWRDGDDGSDIGILIPSSRTDGWALVKWNDGYTLNYRIGYQDKYDLIYVQDEDRS